jgi:hypothetical protein
MDNLKDDAWNIQDNYRTKMQAYVPKGQSRIAQPFMAGRAIRECQFEIRGVSFQPRRDG